MKLVSRYFLTLVVLSLFSITLNAETFRVGYFDIPPHTYPVKKGENPHGKAITFFNQIKERMGIEKVTYELHPLSRLLKMLEVGKLDMVLLLGKNPTRASKFVYPKHVFYNMTPSIVVMNSNPLTKISNVEQLLPLRIGGYQKGYHSPMLRDKRLKLFPLSGTNIETRNIGMMVGGRLDAVYCPDYYIVEEAIKNSAHSDKVKTITLPEKDIGAYSVFSKKSAKKYLKAYEKALVGQNSVKSYEAFLKEMSK